MKEFENLISRLINSVIFLVLIILGMAVFMLYKSGKSNSTLLADYYSAPISPPVPSSISSSAEVIQDDFLLPDTATIPKTKEGAMIRYGRELIVNTSKYIGPQGSAGHFTNEMNCQNCHLDAGTKPFGNNYLSVHSTYPRFRDRSGNIETEMKRVSDCMERSLNGKAVNAESKEMLAILAYLRWVGTGVSIGEKANGSGLKDLAYLDRAADREKGKQVYIAKCKSCHLENGEGQKNTEGVAGYRYPPLWGNNSYNDGAGLYRISMFAKYVKYNMPLGASHNNPQLTDEEAWDVAAFVNSQPRPEKDLSKDWPDISKKPVDHPFGPYADQFSEAQHKYGPFKPIAEANKIKQKI